MRKLVLLLSLCVACTGIAAQRKQAGPPKVTREDLLLKTCPFEPDAPAMKLFDMLETDFDIFTYTTRIKTVKKVRIKIFNEKGYEHASIKIPYFSKRGVAKIKELNGAIYNLGPNGQIITQELDKKDFFREKAVENVGIISFTFPNLKAGSIIEYSYVTIENNIISLSPWFIQDEIPVLYASNILTTPVEIMVYEKLTGADTIQRNVALLRSDQFRQTHYTEKNIPAFRPEPYMSSVKDHLIKMSFLPLPSKGGLFTAFMTNPKRIWSFGGSSYLESKLFREQVKKPIPGTEKIVDSARAIENVEERIGFVYDHVKKRLPAKIEQTIRADSLAEAWENKTGTSGEINLILLNLLERSGVPCIPVLVSTRENGRVNKEFPSLGQLNGVNVLAIDSLKFYILDASIKYQSFLNPPLNVLNREAFLLSKDSMQWVTISDPRPLLKQTVFIGADLTASGLLEGTATIQYFDYAKTYKLDSAYQKEINGDDDFLDKKPQGLRILSTSQSEPGTDQDPLFESIEFVYEPNTTDDFYFINPQLFSAKSKNPFLADKRNTDIDFGCNQLFILTMQINLADSFTIEHLPKNITVRAPDSSFFYKISYSSGPKNISISQLFEVKRAIYSKEEYPGVQDFFKRMYALMAEEIILKKKK